MEMDARPWVTNGTQPKVSDEGLFLALARAWATPAWVYGVTPQPDGRWKCDKSNCVYDQDSQASFALEVTWAGMNVNSTFSRALGVLKLSLSPTCLERLPATTAGKRRTLAAVSRSSDFLTEPQRAPRASAVPRCMPSLEVSLPRTREIAFP